MKSFSLIALAAFPFIVNAFVTPQKAQPDVLPTPQKAQPDVLPTPQKAQPDVLTTPQKAQPDVFPFQAIAPSEVYIRDVPKYAGSGCPEKSASVVLTEDKKAFTIAMSKFSGYIGPGNPAPPVTRLNCQINIDLYVPPGFQYSVFNTTYRGYVDLDDNTEATFAANYYFAGSDTDTRFERSYPGPKPGASYEDTDSVDTGVQNWSTCDVDGMLNVNTEMRLQSFDDKANAKFTLDSVDGNYALTFGVRWRACTPPTPEEEEQHRQQRAKELEGGSGVPYGKGGNKNGGGDYGDNGGKGDYGDNGEKGDYGDDGEKGDYGDNEEQENEEKNNGLTIG